MSIKKILRSIIDHTPFCPVHIGFYTRNLYFKKHLRKLPVEQFEEVLDAGCSNGNYALENAEKFPHWKITAVDINDSKFPASFPANVTFRSLNLFELTDTGLYDFIYSIDVLEHIKGNRAVIENLCRALKPGGYLFIHIPMDKNNRRILPARFLQEFDRWAEEEHVGEQYSPPELSQILKDLGLNTIKSEYTFGFPGKLAWEIDRICDRHFKMKIVLMPLLKLMARCAVIFRHRKGNTLVLAWKAQ